MSVSGKVVLITGADRVIGIQRARQFVSGGASVALHYACPGRRNQMRLFAEELGQRSANVTISLHEGDLGTAAGIEQLFAEIINKHHRIDLVINTSGATVARPDAELAKDNYTLFAYAVFIDEQRRLALERLQAEMAQATC